MEKEWANKDKYHPSNGVTEPRVQMASAKESVRTVSAWGEQKAAKGATGRATLSDWCATPVRSVQLFVRSRARF
jgi:hypothetical protein